MTAPNDLSVAEAQEIFDVLALVVATADDRTDDALGRSLRSLAGRMMTLGAGPSVISWPEA